MFPLVETLKPGVTTEINKEHTALHKSIEDVFAAIKTQGATPAKVENLINE